MTLTEEIGAKIKYYRKKRGMKIVELAALLHKTGATVSKYESGQIAMDVVTLYEVAAALGVPPEKLLYCVPLPVEDLMADSVPAFFRGVDRLYMYYFDGRNNSLVRSVIDIRAKTGANAYDIALYMNFQDYQQYRNCENTYLGTLSHYDALSNIVTHNQDTEMDVYLLCLPASYLNAGTKWGLGLSAHYAYLHQGISVQEHPAGDTGVSAGPAHLPGGRSAAEALQYAVRDVIGPKRIS